MERFPVVSMTLKVTISRAVFARGLGICDICPAHKTADPLHEVQKQSVWVDYNSKLINDVHDIRFHIRLEPYLHPQT